MAQIVKSMEERETVMAQKEKRVRGEELAAARRTGIMYNIRGLIKCLDSVQDDGTIKVEKASDTEVPPQPRQENKIFLN